MELFFDRDQERNGTGIERNENGMIKKKEQEQHDLASGPRSRMEQNDFKKKSEPAQHAGKNWFQFLA